MTEGTAIAYEEAGAGAPPLICLHGIGGDRENFRWQLDGLGPSRRVIAWDMPGFGGSAPLPRTTFASLSGALARLMDRLGVGQAHIVGHSIGGMIAQDFALRHPERAVSLVLIGTSPAFGGRDDSFKQAFLKDRLAPLDAGASMGDLARQSIPQSMGPNPPAAAVASAIRSMTAVDERSFRAILDCLVTFDRRADQHNIRQKCCLIAGSEDRNAPARTMRKMADRLADAEYHEIEGAGHMIQMEAPEACNAIIGNFVARCETPS